MLSTATEIYICLTPLLITTGIFGNHINYILVLATPVSIHLLGVSFTPGSTVSNELSLFGTNLVVSSDGVQMSHITGTDEGRIFVVGDDARLYEVDYKVGEGVIW